MINLSYFKKLKKRLHETTDYFQLKGEKDLDEGKQTTEERRVFYFNTAKYFFLILSTILIVLYEEENDKIFFQLFRYYKTLSLWLEEPRLQESGLYLPALPPQYMSQKLVLLLQGDEVVNFNYLLFIKLN